MSGKLTFETLGNVELLSQARIALFASRNTPVELYPAAEALFSKLTELPVSIAGGWQAPLEKHLLSQFPLSAKANIIHYLARNINNLHLNRFQENLLAVNKLLLVSPSLRPIRVTSSMVIKRDNLIHSQIKKILFLHIEQGGKLERQFNQLYGAGYHIYLLDHPSNQLFLIPDVIGMNADNTQMLYHA